MTKKDKPQAAPEPVIPIEDEVLRLTEALQRERAALLRPNRLVAAQRAASAAQCDLKRKHDKMREDGEITAGPPIGYKSIWHHVASNEHHQSNDAHSLNTVCNPCYIKISPHQ